MPCIQSCRKLLHSASSKIQQEKWSRWRVSLRRKAFCHGKRMVQFSTMVNKIFLSRSLMKCWSSRSVAYVRSIRATIHAVRGIVMAPVTLVLSWQSLLHHTGKLHLKVKLLWLWEVLKNLFAMSTVIRTPTLPGRFSVVCYCIWLCYQSRNYKQLSSLLFYLFKSFTKSLSKSC